MRSPHSSSNPGRRAGIRISLNMPFPGWTRWASFFWVTGISSLCLGDGLPLVQTFHSDFVGSGNCAACHSSLRDEAGQDVSIDSHWRSTMMANAAKDPLWQAKDSSEVQRNPALQSVIEEKCATCHMPMARTQAKALGMPANLDDLKLTASTQQIEDTRIRLISQMQSATASLSVSGVRAGNGHVELGFLVHNLAGHKFPSGFPSRRTWIHFTVTDGSGAKLFESGRPDELGRIEGNDADFLPGGCEPHHRLVSSPRQVQIYESVMENTDGEVTYTLLRGASGHPRRFYRLSWPLNLPEE